MENTTYQEWVRKRSGRSESIPRPAARQKKRRGVALGAKERRRLLQLAVCTMAFVVILVGKGAFPERLVSMREELARMLHADTDFTAAFSNLGRAIAEGEAVTETLGEFCTEVFGTSSEVHVSASSATDGVFYTAEVQRLEAGGKQTPGVYLGVDETQTAADPPAPFVFTAARQAEPARPEPAPEAEPAVIPMEYSGPDLPDNATMDKYRLDIGETAVPVLGWVSSPFGWREHPVDGGEKFHNGVDLAVNLDTPVLAFAAGTVDYIGESPIYGLYLQIDHGNGVTSFYAHCDRLDVQQGQKVKAGEQVALSGQSGDATGPHLHFELKRNQVRLNPLYYIQTQSS